MLLCPPGQGHQRQTKLSVYSGYMPCTSASRGRMAPHEACRAVALQVRTFQGKPRPVEKAAVFRHVPVLFSPAKFLIGQLPVCIATWHSAGGPPTAQLGSRLWYLESIAGLAELQAVQATTHCAAQARIPDTIAGSRRASAGTFWPHLRHQDAWPGRLVDNLFVGVQITCRSKMPS